MENINAFDNAAFNASIAALVALRADHKAINDANKRAANKAELALLFPAFAYAAGTFDLQPLARFVATKEAKPSAIAKRAIKAIFPAHDFALIGDKKRPAFVYNESIAKVADLEKLQVLRDAFNAGDGFDCDQIKAAFPAPKVSNKAEKLEKLRDALVKRMKADDLSKDDIFQLLKGL